MHVLINFKSPMIAELSEKFIQGACLFYCFIGQRLALIVKSAKNGQNFTEIGL